MFQTVIPETARSVFKTQDIADIQLASPLGFSPCEDLKEHVGFFFNVLQTHSSLSNKILL